MHGSPHLALFPGHSHCQLYSCSILYTASHPKLAVGVAWKWG